MDKDSVVAALRGKPEKSADKPDTVIKALNTTESPYPAMMLSDKKDPPPKDKSWGFHLLINCSGLDEKIDSEEDVRQFFADLIKALKMKKLTDFFYKKVDNKEEGRGLSAFQMITTSHIAMHFDDAGRTGYLDIFSCKKFEPDIVIKMVKEYFKPAKIATQFIYRDSGLPLKKGEDDEP